MTSDRELLIKMVEAWEALPGGRNYSPGEVERWLVKDMAPAINKIRRALKNPEKGRVMPLETEGPNYVRST
jgi:hypothetical protein